MVVITAGSSEDHRKREGREGGRRGKRAGRMAEVEGLLASTDYNAARQRRQRRRQRSRYTLMLYSLSSPPRGAASCGALGLTCSRTPFRTCRTCGMNATRVCTRRWGVRMCLTLLFFKAVQVRTRTTTRTKISNMRSNMRSRTHLETSATAKFYHVLEGLDPEVFVCVLLERRGVREGLAAPRLLALVWFLAEV